MELNLFFEAVDSIGGYQSRLLKAIDDEVHFNKCVCTVKAVDDLDIYDEDKYVPINYDICERNRYEEFYDMNSLVPLDRDILEKMLPYESMAMKMLVRNMERDIYTYDESKRLYLNHLRFWNHIFVTHKINYVVLVCVPHHCHDYIIYALAKIYNCGIMVNVATSIWNHWIPVEDIYDCTKDILASYEKYKYEKEIVLSDFIEHYYQSLLVKNKDRDKNLLYAGVDRNKLISNQKKVYNDYFCFKNKWKRQKHIVKRILVNFMNKNVEKKNVNNVDLLKRNRAFSKRARIKQKTMRDIKYYDARAVIPEYEKKYVIYFIQYQPEATTLPMAGVFVEQELVISLLADVLQKYGIELWVKEHFVQPYRSKEYYDKLASIPNVVLVKSVVDSKELMLNSVATATCNGTIAQESIFNGKPVILFGNGLFNGAPGSYSCRTAEDISNAMERIENDNINQSEVRAFLKAFEEHAVHTNIYLSNKNRRCDISQEVSSDNLRKAVVRKIQLYKTKIGRDA